VPKSQFVEARRLRPLLVYCVVAFVVLLVADAAVAALDGGTVRGAVVLSWMIVFPVGGWLVWKRA